MPDQPNLPQGVELRPMNEAFRSDPYRVLKKLRDDAPVLEDRELKRFIYTRHDDVKALLHDKGFFTDPRKANPGSFTREVLGARLFDGEEISMLLMDEPDHRRLRALVSAPFKPHAIERWRPSPVVRRWPPPVPGCAPCTAGSPGGNSRLAAAVSSAAVQ